MTANGMRQHTLSAALNKKTTVKSSSSDHFLRDAMPARYMLSSCVCFSKACYYHIRQLCSIGPYLDSSTACTIAPYLSRDFHWTDEAESLQRLRSGSQPRLIVPRTRLRTIGDRCFRVMAARAWNSLPTSVTTATFLFSFKRQLKTFFFTKSFPEL